MQIDVDSTPLSEALIIDELAKNADSKRAGHPSLCANCGARVDRAFCPECGQTTHIHHSLLHLVEELLHGLFHFDAKAWRTIPALILRPGELTRNYIDGQRTRYVSPLGLFLFLMFLMFFTFSFTGGSFESLPVVDKIHTELNKDLEAQRTVLIASEKNLQALALNTPERVLLEKQIAKQKEDIVSIERILSAAKAKAADTTNPFADHSTESVRRNLEKNVPALATPTIIDGVSNALQNPELVIYKFKNVMSKFSFLLVPISLPFMWLLFAMRRKHSMFEHTVFSLYSLSFMSILMILSSVLATMKWVGPAMTLIFLVPPIHMYRHLRDTYQLKTFATLWRTFALLLVAFISLAIFALIALRLSV